MRLETRQVRIGENLGPIDWAYDFRQPFLNSGSPPHRRRQDCIVKVAELKWAEEHFRAGAKVRTTAYGGWPRIGIEVIVDIGMYDGWPHWRPYPSVATLSPHGVEWHGFSHCSEMYLPWDTTKPGLPRMWVPAMSELAVAQFILLQKRLPAIGETVPPYVGAMPEGEEALWRS